MPEVRFVLEDIGSPVDFAGSWEELIESSRDTPYEFTSGYTANGTADWISVFEKSLPLNSSGYH